MPTRPMERNGWFGAVRSDPDGILERLLHAYPPGSRIAVSSVVGDWSHDLSIETVEKIEQIADGHLVLVTDRYVRGLVGDDEIVFGDDYQGRQVKIRKTNGYGEPITWKFLLVPTEET